MTRTEAAPRHAGDRHKGDRRAGEGLAGRLPAAGRLPRRPLPVWLIATAVGLLTTGLRLVGLARSGDLFVDELIYHELGRTADAGGFPYTEDGLFFLHPPGFFYLQAGWLRILPIDHDLLSEIYAIRVLNSLIAGGTAVLIVVLVARIRSRTAGAVAGAIFALDQYCIRQNDRAMLDTETMFWVLAGLLLLVTLTRQPPPRRTVLRAAGAGLCFGMAVLTKDHSTLITVLPLLAALALGWGPSRRLLTVTLATTALPYAVYVTVIASSGHLDAFWAGKTRGVKRLAGVLQETGFNSPGTPALSDRLAEGLPGYTTTYLLLLLTPLALFLLLRRRAPVYRLLTLFHVSAILTLGYALGLGTLEEQALYLLFVPNLVALAVTFPVPRGPGAARRVLGALAALAVAGAVVMPAVVYAQERLRPDDGFARLRAYLAAHVPDGTPILTADTGETRGITYWALRDRYRPTEWVPAEVEGFAGARYVVVPWKVIDEGYALNDAREVRRLVADGDLLFSFHGETYGTLALYRLPPAGGGSDDR
ncbi:MULTISPECIES: ArnT family glycosyltransferase [Streptomyces]|uniref:Phospholipid carrier-dependent glycosyltransferase n=1 Tax=Streptomyces solicathayae TaxID=3081768 RepID=A0ABZ0LNJ9_9ACTN|nr:phospholipid carrier-dependent glycosyltransferase [Streptomyces sp. HUAS YS2]WOX20932.1 phospholipid carrier-dependent glycosyltransferase [Streptomyces sp. HUAS YS2]